VVGLLSPFYHNLLRLNKKFRWVPGGNFIDAEAEVLFRDRIVLQNNGVTDSSMAHHWVTEPLTESDRPDRHFWATISVMITIVKLIWAADTASARL
jgi:hypothetical protein